MIDEDKQRFASALEAAAVVYGKQTNAILKRAYFEACKRMTIEEFEHAISTHIQTSKFWPTPTDLLKPTSDEAMAIEAYRIADEAMAKFGSYRHIDFEDKAINAAIRAIGGWAEFGQTTRRDEPVVRDRFKRAYASYRAIGVGDEAGRPLDGIAQADRCKRDAVGTVVGIAVDVVKVKCETTRQRLCTKENQLIEADQ